MKPVLQSPNIIQIQMMKQLQSRSIPTSLVQPSVHDAVFDLHVSSQVSLQGELAGAVEAFEGLAV